MILEKIDVNVEPGKILGIVGPPGSGKTTLLNLIARVYDVTEGRVLLDGKDIRDVRVDDLRSHISFMPQEPFLFAGTIRENITFGDGSITDEHLHQAAKQAALLDTVMGFPNKFETVVGEKGIILSGGQKQRIALARCLLKNTPIFVLDDPISQVDLETGTRIIQSVRHMAGRRTIVIVSHRISAVRFADQVITLEHGRIVESGNHKELLQRNQYYAKTFRLQELEEELYAT